MAVIKLLFAPCSEISRQTSLALDTDIPRSHRAAIRFHYLYCKACRRYRRHIKLIRRALRGIADEPTEHQAAAAPGLPDDARKRLKRALEQH